MATGVSGFHRSRREDSLAISLRLNGHGALAAPRFSRGAINLSDCPGSSWRDHATLDSASRKRVGEPELDEGLASHANSFCFAVDRIEKVDGEIDVHPLNFTAGSTRLRPVDVRRHVDAGISQLVEFFSADPLLLCLGGIASFRPCVPGGPR